MNRLVLLIFIVILASLFVLSGCSEQSGKNKEYSSADTINKELNKSMENAINKLVPTILTADIIDKTPDDQLVQTVADNLFSRIPQDGQKMYETVLTFNKAQQAIFVIWCLDGEVNNGGFNQFYFNSTGQFAPLMPNALQLIGANKYADVVRQANKIYETKYDKITKDQDGTLDGFSKSYDDNPLNDLDHAFYALDKAEDLQRLQIDFIRKNKKDFITK